MRLSSTRLALVLLMFAVPLLAGNRREEQFTADIKAGIRLSVMQEYADALQIFDRIKRQAPESPVGYFFSAAVLQTRMMDYENYDDEKAFLAQVDSALTYARKQIRKNKSAWNYFYLGGSYGYLAFYRSKQNQYWQALTHARKSVAALKKAVALDSTIYDAYLGIGTYKYYRSKLSRYFTWLPVVGDERQEGLAQIRLAMNKSTFSTYSAMNGISWILMDEQRYDEGLEIVMSALDRFPDSRVFLWAAAKLNQKLERWPEAARMYERILASFDRQQVDSPYNRIVCRKNLCEIYIRLGEKQKARIECQRVAELPDAFQLDKRVSDKLRDLAEKCADEFAQASTAESE